MLAFELKLSEKMNKKGVTKTKEIDIKYPGSLDMVF